MQASVSEITLNLDREIYGVEDHIFEEGWAADKIYFIAKGRIVLLQIKTHTYIREIREGDSIGEAGFFSRLTRCVTARSSTFTELLVLSSKKMDEVLEDHK